MASLAKLKFTEEEIEVNKEILSNLIDRISLLNNVDTSDVKPCYELNNHIQFLRQDEVKEGLSREEVMQNSIDNQYGYFKLFNIID